jgi:hypothetical protein
MALIELSDIVNMLTARIEQLCAEVLPMGRREGKDWVEACRAKGGLGNGLKVCLSGARRGIWSHFGDTNAGGDALELISYVLFNGDKKKAIAWAKSFLGLDKSDPGRIKQERQKARALAKKSEQEAAQDIARRQSRARAMWLSGSKHILRTPLDFYLYGRGIRIVDLAHIPNALRFAPHLKHPNGSFYPAMMAAITTGAGEFTAVHRTYLQQRAPGVFVKAPLGEQAKLVLGPYAGGFIPLNRGISNKSLKEAPQGDHVVLCEGIEDGLSVALACPELRVLACVSVGNFINLRLPQAITKVTIAGDNDAPDSAAARSLQHAVDRFIDEGREVFVARSPQGKDFNDLLQALQRSENRGAA